MDDLAGRHDKQTLLDGVGPEGRDRLRRSHALVVGAGGLGCVALDWLARAGVGRLTVIDRDLVEPSNLHRQVLFDERDARARRPKAEAAAERLALIDASLRVEAVVGEFEPGTAEELVEGGVHGRPDLLLDGADNFETRYLLNDVAVKHAVPLVYAGAVGTSAMAALFDPGSGGPCLRCVFPEPPPPASQPTCESAGVLGPAVGLAASWQAALAIGRLAGAGIEAAGRTELVELDPWRGRARRVDLGGQRDPECPCCALGRSEFLDGGRWSATAELCGRGAVQIRPRTPGRADLAAIADRWDAAGAVERGRSSIRLVLEHERVSITLFRDGRALIEGASGLDQARSIYARFVGA